MLQKRVPDWVRGRVFGAITFAWALPSLGGLTFSSILGDPIGVVPVFDFASLLYLLAAVIALVTLPSDVAEPMAMTRQAIHAAGGAKKGS